MVNIPQKFYVARQKRKDDEILAYMVVADKEHTKAFKSTKDKADSWSVPRRYDAENQGYKQLEPIYVDNTPRTGFRIVTNVSRYSTSNVVWRIMHPEGFEFEITSDNMCDLMDTNTISEGLIVDEMFFTETRKLVNNKTKLFASMIQKEEEKKEHKAKIDVLEVGSTIKVAVKHTYYPENRELDKVYEFVYVGKFHTCNSNKNRPMVITNKSSSRPVLLDLSTGKYRTFSVLPEFELLDNELVNVDRDETIIKLNESIRDTSANRIPVYYMATHIPNEILPIFFSEKSYSYSDLKLVFENIPSTEVNDLDYNKVYCYNGFRIFGFYCDNVHPEEYRSENHNHVVTGLFGEKIESYEQNGLPVINTDIYSTKEILGYHGAFKKTAYQWNCRIDVPETIEVGYYTIGE